MASGAVGARDRRRKRLPHSAAGACDASFHLSDLSFHVYEVGGAVAPELPNPQSHGEGLWRDTVSISVPVIRTLDRVPAVSQAWGGLR